MRYARRPDSPPFFRLMLKYSLMKKTGLDNTGEREYSDKIFEKVQLKSALAESKTFCACVFRNCDFTGTTFRFCKFRECRFESCNLSLVKIPASCLSGTDLPGAIFAATDLTKANLAGARNYAINASKNKVKDARFSLPEALSLLHCLDIRLV